MDIRNTLQFPAMMEIAIMVAALIFPANILAAGVGEIKSLNTQDEPLHLRVTLIPGQGERVESPCLSLVAPDTHQQDTGIFLTEADLSVIAKEKQQYVTIKSLQPAGKTYTKLRLQIKCPSVLGLVKTLAIPPPLPSVNNNTYPSSPSVYSEKTDVVESASLLEQQKQLAATIEGMQQKIQFLEDELRNIKLQLVPANATPSSTTENAKNIGFNLSVFLRHWVIEGILEAIEMMALALLFLWLGLRLYNRRKPDQTRPTQPVVSTQIATGSATPSPMISTPSPSLGAPPYAAPQLFLSPDRIDESTTSDDSMLEEASLYAANGRMEKAVDILKEIIGRNPSKENAWKLLLSIYSALGKATEFEKTARNFLKYHNAGSSWGGIQVLGRTLDRDNPLYASQDSKISASPLLPSNFTHRPIGDVLIEMGALSKLEMVKYLDEFDPRQHGRFGGYLVARKAITLRQLDLALLRQQGSSNIEAKPDNLPSLQEVEKLLDEFDAKQHGSVIKFLASRNIALPEQLGQYLLQQKNKPGTV